MKTHRALGHKTLAAVLAPHALFFALNFADDEIPAGLEFIVMGWEWICRWCGHINRGTDSSRFCEKCDAPR